MPIPEISLYIPSKKDWFEPLATMWLESFQVILQEIKGYLNRNKAKKEKAFEAIEAILKASNRTSIFITKQRKGTYKSDVVLSELWLEAASKVRDLDLDLYMKLLENAEYWANPKEWDDNRIERAKTFLLELKRTSKKLLE